MNLGEIWTHKSESSGWYVIMRKTKNKVHVSMLFGYESLSDSNKIYDKLFFEDNYHKANTNYLHPTVLARLDAQHMRRLNKLCE